MHEKPAEEEYKLSHDDFVTTYGVNDTAAAIIHMYLRKHTAGLQTVRIMGGLTSAAGLVASAVADAKKPAPGPGQVNSSTDRDYPSWVYPVLAVGGGSVGFGLVQMAVWSRLECYQTLYQYHRTGKLPGKVRHRLTKFLIKTQNREFGD